MRRRNIWKTGKQKQEPVSSTSRRVARAAYRDEYPRDFGPRIAYTVSWVSDTSRPPNWQGGREMSAPRPYETYPFHQQSSVHVLSYDQFQYIYKTVPVTFSMWYLHCGLKHYTIVIYACALSNYLFQGLVTFWGQFVLYAYYGTYWYKIRRDTAIETRHRCIAKSRWCSKRANFASLGKETVSLSNCPWHPRSNGQTERFVQTFEHFLRRKGVTRLSKA